MISVKSTTMEGVSTIAWHIKTT